MSATPMPRSALHDAGAALVRRRAGLQFTGVRRAEFEAALDASMRRTEATSAAAYLARLEVDPRVLDDLIADVTVGETYFFRDPQQLDMLRRRIMPSWTLGGSPLPPIRLWSAGCATGEEPYTLAILLRDNGVHEGAHIIGTDLSRRALRAARKGSFGRWALRGTPDRVVEHYFAPIGNRYLLAPTIRDAVELRYLNLAEANYPSLSSGIWGMDLILCRNVMIYFDRETVVRVAQRLLDALNDSGWLLLGAADPVLTDLVPCDVTITDAGLAYRRIGAGAIAGAGTAPAFVPPASDASLPALPAHAREAFVAESAIFPVPAAVEDDSSEGSADVAKWYAARDYDRAAALAARLLRTDRTDESLWVLLVRAFANRGNLAAAANACTSALDQHRLSGELTYLHAVLLSEAGEFASAAAAARRALYLDDGLVVAHLTLGAALAHLGDVDGARVAFRNAQRLLATMAPAAVVPAADGELAGRLAEIARIQLALVRGAAA